MRRLLVLALLVSTVPALANTLDAVHRHPSGVFFRHPTAWSVQAMDASILALTPSDVRRTNGQPAEVILLMGEEAPGVSDPAAREVVATVERLVAQTFPFLERTGDVQRRDVGGRPTAVLDWKGTSPAGFDAGARMWITLMQGSALAGLYAGPIDMKDARAAVVEDVVGSIGYEAPKGDARVVGRWRFTRTYMSGDFSMVDERYLTLRADGTFHETGQLMGGMQHGDGSGGYAGDTSIQQSGGPPASGRWHTANKRITLEWSDGSVEEWDYLITSTDLMFKSGSTKKLWERID